MRYWTLLLLMCLVTVVVGEVFLQSQLLRWVFAGVMGCLASFVLRTLRR